MADINELKAQTENFANAIWTVADILHGPFNDDEYGEVILPFALFRRFECVLSPSREKVLETKQILEGMKILGDNQYDPLCVAAGFPFYNTSEYSFATIGETHTKENLLAYKDGFSPNVRTILDHFEFERICERLQKSEKIYAVVDFFKQLDLNVPPRVMSNLYEELIWRFADTKHKASKEYLTPRDVVHLATTLVLDSDGDVLTSNKGLMRTIYDPTCGTCGFITDAMNFIRETTSDSPARTTLIPYGQEINDIAWAMGKAMILLSGLEESGDNGTTADQSKNILQGNTLKKDCHEGTTFDYVFSNPPFGMDWKDVADSVNKDPRFSVGLPPRSDGSMLFLTHVAEKMAPVVTDADGQTLRAGHGAIVLSGSPLFTGGAGSGSSEIRRWLFENDKVEAIVQLPGELFYNTSITTYLWILSNGKSNERRGKVILIDASGFKTSIKNIGKKRYMLSSEQIAKIATIFRDYRDTEFSKVLNHRNLGYRAVTVQRPLRMKLEISEERLGILKETKAFKNLSEEAKNALEAVIRQYIGTEQKLSWIQELSKEDALKGFKFNKSALTAVQTSFGMKESEGEVVLDAKGNKVWDPDLKQTENISLDEDLDTYMEREVLPFVSDAVADSTITDSKDGKVGIVGYEVNFNKYFYKYVPPRTPEEIAKELLDLEKETALLMQELFK